MLWDRDTRGELDLGGRNEHIGLLAIFVGFQVVY